MATSYLLLLIMPCFYIFCKELLVIYYTFCDELWRYHYTFCKELDDLITRYSSSHSSLYYHFLQTRLAGSCTAELQACTVFRK